MASTKRIARILFIGACALLNFIYLTVSTIVVFDKIFAILLKNKNAFSLIDSLQRMNTSSGQIAAASMSSIYFLPLYLALVLIGLVTAIMFLYFMIEIPKLTAMFYMDRLDGFLFIDKRKTIKFFIVILLPILFSTFLYVSGPVRLREDYIESMILCTITHTGICLFLFFIKSLKEKSYQPEDEKKIFKFFNASFMRVVLFVLSAVFMVLPYLLYYHYETDIIRVGAFHFFLISALVPNYKFYNENFMKF